MMKKRLIIGMMAAVMAFGTAMTAYAAGIWEYNRRGDYWWYLNDDGNWSASTWQWIDGNKDDIAECYYFDATDTWPSIRPLRTAAQLMQTGPGR